MMIELTKVVIELLQLLTRADVDIAELDERMLRLKHELGAWFMDGYPLYEGS